MTLPPQDPSRSSPPVVDDIEDFGTILARDYDDFHTTTSTRRRGDAAVVRIRRLKGRRAPRNPCNGGNNGSCCNKGGSAHHHHHHQLLGSRDSGYCDDDEDDGYCGESVVVSNDLNPSNHIIYVKTWGCSHNNSDSEYMAGLLAGAGYRVTTTDYTASSLILLNSCTVKGPSEQHFKNEISRATSSNKHMVLAGCVPQSDKSYRKLASVIGVQQIDRIVEVVEETLKGNKLSFLTAKRRMSGDGGRVGKGPGADLDLPKIRKNELIEIVPVSSGCLNSCTYCKTKLARGALSSYSVSSILTRIRHVITADRVKEIWLTSEDLGAWGIDLGLTIVDLLNSIVLLLSEHERECGVRVMLRLGMTNPPYIMDHLEDISRILAHPNVYEFLHIPVQSGSDSVLLEMRREYGRGEFERICDFLIGRHPQITIATDMICGYPTETNEDFEQSYSLVEKYRFPVLFINQFYPRPGTAAAKLKRIPTDVVKSRTRRLNELFQSYERGNAMVGSIQRVLITEVAHDGVKFVGHNKQYEQVLVDEEKVSAGCRHGSIMGEWVDVTVAGVGKFSVVGGDGAVVVVERGVVSIISNHAIIIIIIFVILCVMLCYVVMRNKGEDY